MGEPWDSLERTQQSKVEAELILAKAEIAGLEAEKIKRDTYCANRIKTAEAKVEELKAENKKLEAINKGLVKDFNNLLIDGSDQTLITELRVMAETLNKNALGCCEHAATQLTALLNKEGNSDG